LRRGPGPRSWCAQPRRMRCCCSCSPPSSSSSSSNSTPQKPARRNTPDSSAGSPSGSSPLGFSVPSPHSPVRPYMPIFPYLALGCMGYQNGDHRDYEHCYNVPTDDRPDRRASRARTWSVPNPPSACPCPSASPSLSSRETMSRVFRPHN